MTHELKVWPRFFAALADGRERFEVRSTADRTFAEGDALRLQEWDPEAAAYTGRSLRCVVTYVVAGAPFLPDGTAVLSLSPPTEVCL